MMTRLAPSRIRFLDKIISQAEYRGSVSKGEERKNRGRGLASRRLSRLECPLVCQEREDRGAGGREGGRAGGREGGRALWSALWRTCSVSAAIFFCLCGGMLPSVRMLCSRSASFTMMILTCTAAAAHLLAPSAQRPARQHLRQL